MKLFKVLLGSVLALGLVACGEAKEKLFILNWGEYMDDSLVEKFEKEYNVDVVYEVVESNEAMYSKIVAGTTNYDIAIPSDYMLEKMAGEGLINELDLSLLDVEGNVDPKFYDLTDFENDENYYIPYFYGSVGILYNTDLVDEKDLTGFDVLWNDKYENQIMMYDSIRDVISIGALKNGYSINTTNEGDLAVIEADLKAQSELNNGYGTDDIKNMVASGNIALAPTYSGDYLMVLYDAEETGTEANVGFYIPEDGTNVWVDGMVIPTTSNNSELAHKFINFMLQPENAKQNAEWVGYSTTHPVVFEEFVAEDPEYYLQPAYTIPEDIYAVSESYKDLGTEMYQLYSDIYTSVKND